ncbi:iron-sulfur cluster biosynthesis family protein [Salipaludibacillus daqingensis]|uniref:iron-sulfur cluster biosynthesis family protein n=1 Tax=Salipaludibacillus daqingensis TaxID=3041001 RepID=UPI002476F653|nr:iron-sulfur cluster biosynthesis family protein [Salipaludibacillus daqingensis]
MEIEITNSALQKIKESAINPNENVLLLQYETDDCGCVVNGVSKLVEIYEENLTDEEIVLTTKPAPYRVAIQKRVEWVYDNDLKVDYSDSANMLQLKSPNQMLNPRMSFNAIKK